MIFLSVRVDNNQHGVTARPFQPGSLRAHFVNGRAPIGRTVGAESPNLESVNSAGRQTVEQSAILRIGQHANGPGVRIRRAFFRRADLIFTGVASDGRIILDAAGMSQISSAPWSYLSGISGQAVQYGARIVQENKGAELCAITQLF
jgi:hypothetical protein